MDPAVFARFGSRPTTARWEDGLVQRGLGERDGLVELRKNLVRPTAGRQPTTGTEQRAGSVLQPGPARAYLVA
jgi:hypothetical protein